MNTVKTPKGTELPLVNLKGKDYLMVAHRLVWFNEASDRFNVSTDFLLLTDEQTVARAHVVVFNEKGEVVKSATATKRETKKDFSDHTEKAETGAIGRALALMGYGTQFAIADLDEGNRLADSPVVNTKVAAKSEVKVTASAGSAPQPILTTETLPNGSVQATERKISTFRKTKPTPVTIPGPNDANGPADEWT